MSRWLHPSFFQVKEGKVQDLSCGISVTSLKSNTNDNDSFG